MDYIQNKNIFKKLKENKINIHPDSYITAPFSVGIGTNINGKITVKGFSKCTIGNYCAIGYDVIINTSDHLVNRANLQVSLQNRIKCDSIINPDGKVTIGNNIWIGDSVLILPGNKIGDGAVIGTGAIVTKDVPPFTIVAGAPAKILRKRFGDNVIRQLLEIKWWYWTEEKMIRNQDFFNLDLSNSPDINLKNIIKD